MRITHYLVLFSTLLCAVLAFAVRADTIQSLFRHANDPIGGNPRGKITVVEFFDYQCSHCMAMAPVIQAVIAANPDVRIVYKDFPIRGSVSEFAARAALAANKQGRYAALNHALLTTNLSLSEMTVLDIAAATGLNMDKLKKDMSSLNIRRQLNDNLIIGQRNRVIGTPVFFIGKTNAQDSGQVNYVFGEMSQSEMQDAIDKARR